MSLTPAYVALGSNLDEPAQQVEAGIEELSMLPDTRLAAISSLYLTAPVGYVDQPQFVNAVACVETALDPRALLDALLEIERRYGRVRDVPNGPRTLDLDIVLYGNRGYDDDALTIPHPRMHERAFVLVPLYEIAPDAVVPGRGPVRDLVKSIDTAGVSRMSAAER